MLGNGLYLLQLTSFVPFWDEKVSVIRHFGLQVETF